MDIQNDISHLSSFINVTFYCMYSSWYSDFLSPTYISQNNYLNTLVFSAILLDNLRE